MRVRAVAVEEEFLLVDAATLRPVSRVEPVPSVVRDLADLDAALRDRRRRLAAAAAAGGALLVATGTSPFHNPARCGCSVRVAVGCAEEAGAVRERLSPWLPALVAIAANSPFWRGADTGYASYRTQLRDGPGGQVPQQARAGHRDREPSVEVRVADVAREVDDAVLVAALVRALVDTAVRQWRDGIPPVPVRPELARLATWRASRSGLSGVLVDIAARRAVPARVLVGRLVRHVHDSLDDTGDLALVEELVAGLLARGTGATRQREAYRRHGRLEDVVRLLADRTAPLAPVAT